MHRKEHANCINLLRLFIAVILAFGLLKVHAQVENDTKDHYPRPDPPGTPTKIETRILLLDIDEIDGAQQNFTANVFYSARWQAPRLSAAGTSTRTMSLKEAWHPKLQIVNRQRLWASFPEELRVRSEGVRYLQRYWGQFSNPLNLRDFPLDYHTFEVRLVAIDPSSEVQLVNFDDPKTQSALGDQLSIPDWDILSWEAGPEDFQPVPGAPALSSYVFRFTAK